MLTLLTGMSAMGFVIAALFFLRFWRRTSDYLFLAFSGAFVLLALTQALLVPSAASRSRRLADRPDRCEERRQDAIQLTERGSVQAEPGCLALRSSFQNAR